MAYKVMQQYGAASAPGTVYYCDEKSDLDKIEKPPMGSTAFVIHGGGTVYMADSEGQWYPI